MTLTRPAPADLVIDTSALMAVILDETVAKGVRQVLVDSRGPVISAATLLELLLVSEGRQGPTGPADARGVLHEADVVVVPVDEPTIVEAHEAWRRFGTGNHRARLNYGDCFAYAVAKRWELPLLCVGDDFHHTDIDVIPLGASSSIHR